MVNEEEKWAKEYQAFCTEAEDANFPAEHLWQELRRRMVPTATGVFAKIFGVHAVVGTFSLAICDQFEMSPFQSGFSLSEYFMKFGHSVCMLLCGFLFLSLSLSLAHLFLRSEDIWVLRQSLFLQISGLSVLSLGFLMALGAEVVLGVALLWLLGALAGGVLPTLFYSQMRFGKIT